MLHCHCVALILLLSLSLPNAATAFSINNVRSRIPEEVVQRQLDDLRKADVAKAYEYNSPSNQEAVGNWENFAAMLSDKSFRPILCHSESTVLMTVSHDEDDEYVCCLVRIVLGKDPLPENIQSLIGTYRGEDENKNNDDDDDDEEETEERDYLMSTKTPSCVLYWWEVSQQYDEESKSYHYLIDSVLPDAEDIESDFMETTLFSIDDEDFGEDDDDDDGSFFFLDFGLY